MERHMFRGCKYQPKVKRIGVAQLRLFELLRGE